VGGFGELSALEDLDLCARLRRAGRIALVPEAGLTISARRWEREGRLRRTLANWGLRSLFAAGVSPRWLARHYSPEEGGAAAPEADRGGPSGYPRRER
jgi:hypothetical protein